LVDLIDFQLDLEWELNEFKAHLTKMN
jgi:hypothetical protein